LLESLQRIQDSKYSKKKASDYLKKNNSSLIGTSSSNHKQSHLSADTSLEQLSSRINKKIITYKEEFNSFINNSNNLKETITYDHKKISPR